MKPLIISYDAAEGVNYDALHNTIKGYEDHAHLTESTWVVFTQHSIEAVFADLGQYLPEGSRLVVIKAAASGDFEGRNLISQAFNT